MKKHRGRKWMALGLVLIFGALVLSVYNVLQEHTGYDASMDDLIVLSERIAVPPENGFVAGNSSAEGKETSQALQIVSPAGEAMDWPVDDEGNPVPWPVDQEGNPLLEVPDGRGGVLKWNPEYDAFSWNSNAEGALLPWFSNAAGEITAWPQDEVGALLDCGKLQSLLADTVLQTKNETAIVEKVPMFVKNPNMEMPLEKIKGNYYIGILEIPLLKLSLPVMSDWSYPKLRVAPCRYAGSVYSGDLVIAGHNYSRHFGSIKRLQDGDEVRFTDADGNVFFYTVTRLEQLGRYDVDKMKHSDSDLTLFTCTYGGRSRVTVRCRLVGYEAA